MTLKELGLSDEEVQDIIASLVASDANVNWTYDDANNELQLSLDSSISISSITDGAGVSHNGELADAADVSPIQSSSDVIVTDTQPGTVSDGEFLKNSGGSLVGATVNVQGALSNIQVFESDGTFNASNADLAYVEVVGGGGGGGESANFNGGAGGAGGGYAAKFVDLSTTSSVSVTVGAGSTGAFKPSSGGTSSFGSFLSATGGDGANRTFGGPIAVGGVGSGGDVNIRGGGGDPGQRDPNGNGEVSGGGGGSSMLGGGGAGGHVDNITGGDGGKYGGGGGGGGGSSGGGGNGADGVVIVRD